MFGKSILLGVAMAGSLGGYAVAKDGPIRGTIDSVTRSTLNITETNGAKISVALLPGVTVIDVVPGSLRDVTTGTYVGTAAMKQPDGTYRALELQIFPASMAGVGLGTQPWNLKPHSTMTNGTVGGITNSTGTVGAVSKTGALSLQVNDGAGVKTVLLPTSAPIVTFEAGSAADLKPGAHVMLFPKVAADGSLSTGRINVGKNGLVPPM
ncbi:MAG: hypothetical protein B7Z75_08785 [Acidocella sp. 20-57-95]|nr:MAG: hypothetical protein B7Z75_08785 [Acidocella sp. 20-57-95]OYV61596.1 MAG: hypothetical protein B7Z71_04375 [Acidocella sp. 21-58-7]HQT64246.1 hypothetical protein [Acidocella sp.]HQU04672.1 hypothetical protein [Acidocella sp.]